MYQLRSTDDPKYVQSLAAMIHERMTQVEKATQTVDSVRVAVLAALNLADEYCKLQAEYEKRIEDLLQEKEKLLKLVETALEEEPEHPLPDA